MHSRIPIWEDEADFIEVGRETDTRCVFHGKYYLLLLVATLSGRGRPSRDLSLIHQTSESTRGRLEDSSRKEAQLERSSPDRLAPVQLRNGAWGRGLVNVGTMLVFTEPTDWERFSLAQRVGRTPHPKLD
jgi:hypothetical protein